MARDFKIPCQCPNINHILVVTVKTRENQRNPHFKNIPDQVRWPLEKVLNLETSSVSTHKNITKNKKLPKDRSAFSALSILGNFQKGPGATMLSICLASAQC